MALRPCERKQIIITNIGSKLYSIFESDKSYGKKEKGVGRGIQDCREQGEDFRYGVRVGVIEKGTLKMRDEPHDGAKYSRQRKQTT